jgi:hypothetical protein
MRRREPDLYLIPKAEFSVGAERETPVIDPGTDSIDYIAGPAPSGGNVASGVPPVLSCRCSLWSP